MLQQRTALVTGGSAGIGAGIVAALCREGARVVNLDRQVSTNADVTTIQADLKDLSGLEQAFTESVRVQGPPDILVNNAGISARISATEYPIQACVDMAAINLWTPFRLMQLCAKEWIARNTPGCIVNIASVYGMVADPLSAPYAATKGGLIQLTRTCAVEWAPLIRVNAVAPGYTRTEMTANTLDSDAGKRILAKVPFGRAATTEEIASAVLYLVSPAASFVTGHILTIDGGFTAQ